MFSFHRILSTNRDLQRPPCLKGAGTAQAVTGGYIKITHSVWCAIIATVSPLASVRTGLPPFRQGGLWCIRLTFSSRGRLLAVDRFTCPQSTQLFYHRFRLVRSGFPVFLRIPGFRRSKEYINIFLYCVPRKSWPYPSDTNNSPSSLITQIGNSSLVFLYSS